MGVNIDTWIKSYKVRAINWVDGKTIYFNVQYYAPGQFIEKPPVWDNTVYIVDNPAGQRLVNEFTDSLVEHVAKMDIKSGMKVVIKA
jgi:hypothetical protein